MRQWRAWWLGACLLEAGILRAQAAPPATLEAALQAMSNEAQVAFTGEVRAIRRLNDVVEVDWAVEEAVFGATAGEIFTEREWSGLWQDGDRYLVGQRSLVMLHGSSAAGLQSPVGGMTGVIPVRGDAMTGTADLRWVATQIVRADADAKGGVVSVRSLREAAHLGNTRAVNASEQDASDADLGKMDRSVVVAMLRVWHAQTAAVR